MEESPSFPNSRSEERFKIAHSKNTTSSRSRHANHQIIERNPQIKKKLCRDPGIIGRNNSQIGLNQWLQWKCFRLTSAVRI